MKSRFLHLLVLLVIIFSPQTARTQENYEHKATFYNILSIIQNSYVNRMENWVLLTGAVSGLEELLKDESFNQRQSDTELVLSYPGGTSVSIKRESVAHNAYMLIEGLSEICVNAFHAIPAFTKQEIVYAAINGIVSTLDSHSSFISADEFTAMRSKNRGVFGGIGVELIIKDGVLTVVSPFEGTPAHKIGLKANDKIVRINNESTADMSLMKAVGKIRGPGGTKVKLSVLREPWEEARDFSITRKTTQLHSVKSRMLESGIVYLQIVSFLSTSFQDTLNILVDQSRKGEINGLALDLRNNPGGLLEQSEDIADMFLDRGMIVFSKGPNKDQNMTYLAHRDHRHYDFPIVIIVNEGSASGTEIVAASLNENNRAMLIGTRTFGKGTIQTIFPVMNGAALRLTTAEFFTPSGKKIEAVGVLPDLLIKNKNGEKRNKRASDQVIEENNLPTIIVEDNKDDFMLRVAVDLLKCAKDKEYAECIKTVSKSYGNAGKEFAETKANASP